MAANTEGLQSEIQKLTEVLNRDLRNLQIIRRDKSIDEPIIPVPDCSDLITFVHITDQTDQQPDAYTEGIRRYFVKYKQLMLIPAWAFEFINHIHRYIVDYFEQFGDKGGHGTFLKQFPNAFKFRELWASRKFREAEDIYAKKETWVQILAFTQSEVVEELLGNVIRRFSYLAQSGKFMKLNDFIEGNEKLSLDEKVFNYALDRLSKLRPQKTNSINNEIDARGFATAYALTTKTKKFFTAVTASKYPLKAFYQTIDREILDDNALSLARSPITDWVGELVKAVAKERETDYLDRGIAILTELINLLKTHDVSIGKLIPENSYDITSILDDTLVESFKAKGKLEGLLEPYDTFYRDILFRPIEKKGVRKLRFPNALTPDKAVIELTPEKFEQSMKEARRSLRDSSIEMVQVIKPYVDITKLHQLGKLNLSELLKKTEEDFNRDVF